jgi:DNA polymerase-1
MTEPSPAAAPATGHVILVDLFSLVFQVFHAIPEMTSPDGQPTNAVFGIARDMISLLKNKQPTHLIVAGEGDGPGVRSEWYPEYKANRSEMPEPLQPQIPMIVELIEAFAAPIVSVPGWEADDVIATLSHRAADAGYEVTIITNDKDARQLLRPGVRLFNVRKEQFFGIDELQADWGVTPEQVVHFQALVGDSVDNVPGVPLIGPKKATALLAQFGTLEQVLANADAAPGAKLKENLKQYADLARLSLRLVTLNRELPIELDWQTARVGGHRVEGLTKLFQRFGFRRFISEVKTLPSRQTAPVKRERTLFDDPEDDVAEPAPIALPKRALEYRIIDTPAKFEGFLRDLAAQPQFCLDLETTGLDPVRADIVGWSFSWQPHVGYYIPVRCPAGGTELRAEEVAAALKVILETPGVRVDNQNIKYDLIVLNRIGIRPSEIGRDPMVGSYLLDAGARTHSLDDLARRRLDHEMIPISDLIGKGASQKSMADVPVPKIAEYAAEDAEVAWELAGRIEADLKREGLWDLYDNLERPLIRLLADMQIRGIRVDVPHLRVQSAAAAEQLVGIQREIYELAGRTFNIDSPIQLRQILFDELGLPIIRRTKTGASTDQDVLEELAPRHPLPAKILEHRGLTKLKNTYLDALPELLNPDTGRIHTSFNQVVAATGRLSSSEPNLQNIPIRTDQGALVRQAFIAGKDDWQLLCADYSQVELRMLAHFSGDEALARAFADGVDIHTSVASEIFSVPLEEVTPERRRIAKAVNFGVIYGQSPYGLAAALGIEQSDAATFIDNYFARYAGIDGFLTKVLEETLATGYARTILGRRRPISGIKNTTGRQRNLPERTAINTVIQGSAADLIKRAMLNVEARIAREQHPGQLLLQIHDELVLEAPRDAIASLAVIVREEMEQAMTLSVPLRVDVEAGPNWLDTTPVAT